MTSPTVIALGELKDTHLHILFHIRLTLPVVCFIEKIEMLGGKDLWRSSSQPSVQSMNVAKARSG